MKVCSGKAGWIWFTVKIQSIRKNVSLCDMVGKVLVTKSMVINWNIIWIVMCVCRFGFLKTYQIKLENILG